MFVPDDEIYLLASPELAISSAGCLLQVWPIMAVDPHARNCVAAALSSRGSTGIRWPQTLATLMQLCNQLSAVLGPHDLYEAVYEWLTDVKGVWRVLLLSRRTAWAWSQQNLAGLLWTGQANGATLGSCPFPSDRLGNAGIEYASPLNCVFNPLRMMASLLSPSAKLILCITALRANQNRTT